MTIPPVRGRILSGVLLVAFVAACAPASPSPSPAPSPSPEPVAASPAPTTPPPTTPPPTDPSTPDPSPKPTPPQAPGTRPPAASIVVFVGGTILTMDPALPRASALAIEGERILAVGEEAEVLARAGPQATVVDLAGSALLPGFNDAHSHRIGDRNIADIETAEEAIALTLADGFTSISELFVSQERLDELIVLDEAGLLRLRVNAYLPVNYLDQKFGVWFEHLRPHQQMSPRVRIGGVKAFADEMNPQLMLLSEDHPLQPGFRGLEFWAPDEMADLVASLHRDGWQVAIHTAGDGAHDMVLDAFERALDGRPNEARHRIEHLAMLRADQIERMAALGIVASLQMGWFNSLWTEEWLGALPGLADRLGRWRDLLDAGVAVVGSTDAPWAAPVGPAMLAIAQAVTRQAEPGASPAGWQLRQRITVDEALELLTVRGAWATFEEAEKGTLEPGKLADLVILSADPTALAAEQLFGVSVLATFIGGVAEYCAPGAETLCPIVDEQAPQPAPQPARNLAPTASVRASSERPEDPATNVIDGTPAHWNAAELAPQWVELRLPHPADIEEIVLEVAQYPPGPSFHELWIGQGGDEPQLVHVFSGTTGDGDVLTYRPTEPLAAVELVRVVTTSLGNLAPAWREIELIGAPAR